MTTLPDGRVVPPAHADERAMLDAWLDFHRGTIAAKVAGLDDRQVRLAPVPRSELTLLGLVQHLAEVERQWYQRVFGGLDVPAPHGGTGFALEAGRGMPEALAGWRAEIERGRELTAGAPLDAPGRLDAQSAAAVGSETVSLRWILLHLIEEYARHAGHADLLRESIDGVAGV
ncbi:DinB family protein [Streptomyces sp. NRRL WC-3742]|uniref:DinB family protein n=1 Tax=Streptomyces sp. NRRL WC-3742 TaxID=1463934 RepID=UPI0004CAE84A|nr:DinB family protein [Streptomyces sp. NRRL WC-3742]